MTADTLFRIRHLYKEVSDLPAKTTEFRQVILQLPDEAKVLRLAYQATCEALKARETWLPWEKLAHFQKSMEMFAEILACHPTEIEVRFLRYTIQKNTPSILGLSTNTAEDKREIIAHFQTSPTEAYMKASIAEYLMKHEHLTSQEKAVLKIV